MITDIKNKIIVVIGLGPSGLFVTRQLHNLNKRIIGVGKTDDIGRYSKFLEKQFVANNAQELYATVKKIVSSVDIKPIGLVCSDAYLTYIIEEYPQIFEMLSFISPDERTLRLMYDKEALSKMLKTLNVRTPHRYSELYQIQYPVIIKPIIKRGKSPIPKISFVDNAEQLNMLLSMASAGGLNIDDIIIQEKISGDNDTEYGYGGYFENGQLKNDVAFIQARQYPQGVSCTVIEINDEKRINSLRKLTYPIIFALNYSGFIQFDIKEDSKTKNLYVLDINPRPWGSISIMQPKGENKYGNVFLQSNNQGRNAIWHFPLKELLSFRNKKNIPFHKCRLMAPQNTVTLVDLWDSNDLKPFLMQPIVLLMKLFKR